MAIEDFTNSELMKELQRRELKEKAEAKPKNQAGEFRDFIPVIEYAESIITYMDNPIEANRVKDYQYYMYETAMKCVFGPKVFDWINEQEIYE